MVPFQSLGRGLEVTAGTGVVSTSFLGQTLANDSAAPPGSNPRGEESAVGFVPDGEEAPGEEAPAAEVFTPASADLSAPAPSNDLPTVRILPVRVVQG